MTRKVSQLTLGRLLFRIAPQVMQEPFDLKPNFRTFRARCAGTRLAMGHNRDACERQGKRQRIRGRHTISINPKRSVKASGYRSPVK